MEKVNIGMVGFGYIAHGVFELISKQKEYIAKKTGKELNIIRIAEKDREKLKSLTSEIVGGIKVSPDAADIYNDPEVDIVVELIGGVDPAYDIVMESLKAGKYVVTANKDLIANKGGDIHKTAEANNVDILFEASVLGGIPIIGPLKTTLASDKIYKIVGIVNGTTNYILTRMEKDDLSFKEALSIAQDLGYAEKANPSSDIEGYDAACKLAILSSIAFNSRVVVDDVYKEGITKITASDIKYAAEMGYRIKLLAIGSEEDGQIFVRVHPALVPDSHILASIEDVFNAVYIYGEYIDRVMSYGRGAGDRATASSVVGDIVNIARNFDRDNKKMIYGCSCFEQKKVRTVDETISKFYIVLDAIDRPGVLAKIAQVFGKHSVSIDSMIQKQTDVKEMAKLIFITHEVANKDLYKSVDELSGLDVVDRVANIIRVEELD
ncbi:homoserine dehydrogenase [Actinomycetota bacterium]